jgi:hypothetical protein
MGGVAIRPDITLTNNRLLKMLIAANEANLDKLRSVVNG